MLGLFASAYLSVFFRIHRYTVWLLLHPWSLLMTSDFFAWALELLIQSHRLRRSSLLFVYAYIFIVAIAAANYISAPVPPKAAFLFAAAPVCLASLGNASRTEDANALRGGARLVIVIVIESFGNRSRLKQLLDVDQQKCLHAPSV